jgi:hypothetical protein
MDYYNKTEANNLLNAKDSILTFTSPLVRTTNNITFNETSITTLTIFYNKTESDGRFSTTVSRGQMLHALAVQACLPTRLLNHE